EALDQVHAGELPPPERDESPFVARRVDAEHTHQLERVLHPRTNDIEVTHRLVEPTERAPELAVHVAHRVLDRTLFVALVLADRVRLLAQLIEKARGLHCTGHGRCSELTTRAGMASTMERTIVASCVCV